MEDLFGTTWQDLWSGTLTAESVGAVFTRPEIVELVLDLAGYTASSQRLAASRLLEPSCGDGAFLTTAISRLLESERQQVGSICWSDKLLDEALCAADISAGSIRTARALVARQLVAAGCPPRRASVLASRWIVHTDFLLGSWVGKWDFVIGNPPYVRIEDVPRPVLARYRALYETTTDRADLYVAFIEKGLQLLGPTGVLAFICANRFTKNKYGAALRRLIASTYHVRFYLNLEHTQPFLSDVSAYPAIFVVDRARTHRTLAATLTDISATTLRKVRSEALGRRSRRALVSSFPTWYPNGAPWISTHRDDHSLLTRFENELPALEDSAPGTKVGIGVATGADNVFVLSSRSDQIEESRQIPLLMAYDIANSDLAWSGHFLLNPFADADTGELATLSTYPAMAAYFRAHETVLRGRHVAKRRDASWYRTIDRIWPALRRRPKLVIPDIQSSSTVGLDTGEYYPHHNVYWITSDRWPLLALKALLRSALVSKQVASYSVQMRGGSVRYQAQTLRRIRIPRLDSLGDAQIASLEQIATSDDQEGIDAVAEEAFGTTLGLAKQRR